jgi:hypothetical protein
LQSVLSDDAIDGSFADMEVTLSEFLGDNFGARFGIEETMADYLTNRFLRTPIVRFGPPFGIEESLAAVLEKEGAKLKVTLTAKTELGGGTFDAFRAAFSLDEHGQLAGDFISIRNGKGPSITFDALFRKLERNHRNPPGLELSARK